MSHIPYYNQEDKPVNKNGFEIRADLVALAKDYMEKQSKLNIEYYNELLKIGKISTEDYLALIKPYTLEDILAKAKEIYGFVSAKK